LLGTLTERTGVVICDLEAGARTVLRLEREDVDLVLVVAEPSAKSVEVARHVADIAAEFADVAFVANRVRNERDLESVRTRLPGHETFVIPEDPQILRADEDGLAPIDASPEGPAVQALLRLTDRLTERVPS